MSRPQGELLVTLHVLTEMYFSLYTRPVTLQYPPALSTAAIIVSGPSSHPTTRRTLCVWHVRDTDHRALPWVAPRGLMFCNSYSKDWSQSLHRWERSPDYRLEAWPTCIDHGDTYVPILQLLKEDVPELGFPAGKDLFQLIWCPDVHEEPLCGPLTKSFWRVANEVNEILERMNPPFEWFTASSVPKECKLYLERVEETRQDLEDETSEAISEFIIQHAQEDFDAMNVPAPYRDDAAYEYLFSAAPSTKVGGYCNWIQDGEIPTHECGEEMEHLLTVASGDIGDGASHYRWAPSDIVRGDTGRPIYPSYQGSDLCVGDVGSIYVFVCQKCEGFPTTNCFQCS